MYMHAWLTNAHVPRASTFAFGDPLPVAGSLAVEILSTGDGAVATAYIYICRSETLGKDRCTASTDNGVKATVTKFLVSCPLSTEF